MSYIKPENADKPEKVINVIISGVQTNTNKEIRPVSQNLIKFDVSVCGVSARLDSLDRILMKSNIESEISKSRSKTAIKVKEIEDSLIESTKVDKTEATKEDKAKADRAAKTKATKASNKAAKAEAEVKAKALARAEVRAEAKAEAKAEVAAKAIKLPVDDDDNDYYYDDDIINSVDKEIQVSIDSDNSSSCDDEKDKEVAKSVPSISFNCAKEVINISDSSDDDNLKAIKEAKAIKAKADKSLKSINKTKD